MFRYGPGFHHGPYVFGWVAVGLFAALLVVAVVAIARLWNSPRRGLDALHAAPPWAPADPAVTELRMRFARGDIDEDEYRRRLSGLGYPVPGDVGSPTPPVPPPTSSP